MSNNFNAVVFAERLEDGGLTDKQAKALSSALWELVDTQLATKSDVAALEERLMMALAREWGGLRAELLGTTVEVRVDLLEKIAENGGRIGEVRMDLLEKINEVKVDIANLKSELIMWIVSLVIVQTGIAAVLFKFLH